MTRGKRPAPPGIPATGDVEAMIRVDHAGELGAVRIYEGQLAVLKARKGAHRSVAAVGKMLKQEEGHLKTFDTLVNERHVRPTILHPIWHAAGYALGAATALMGEKAAMAATVAVEEAIDEHYATQIARLDDNDSLKATVAKFRDDELAHRDEALSHGAEEAPAYRALNGAIKLGCRLAIFLSERI